MKENQSVEQKERTCQNCFYFIEGEKKVVKKTKGIIFKRNVEETVKELDTCGYLNKMSLLRARYSMEGDKYCFPAGITSTMPIPLTYKLIEGPCGSEGKFWKPKNN